MKNIISLLSFAILLPLVGLGQTSRTAKAKPLEIMFKVKQNEIMLRWVPTNASVWGKGIEKGYILTRTSKSGKTVQLTPQPLVPTVPSIDAFEDTTKKQNPVLLTVAIYNQMVLDKAPLSERENLWLPFTMSSLMDFPSSMQVALGFVDKDITPLETYIYKISLVADPSVAASVEISASQITKYPVIDNLTAGALKTKIDLSWDENGYKTKHPFYSVEKSTDKTNYLRLEKLPILNINRATSTMVQYGDSLTETGIPYYYRIRGIDYFTEESEPSNVVEVIAVPENMPMVENIQGELNVNSMKTELTWVFPNVYEAYIKDFRIYESEFIDRDYTFVKTVAKTERKTSYKPKATATYVQIAYDDLQGRTTMSLPMLVQGVDTIPPLPPTGLKGKLSKEGLLSVEWLPNKEKDLLGYYVFASNDSIAEPVRIVDSFLTSTTFTDSMNVKNTGNKKLYIYALAIDKRYNHSYLSDVLVIERPDLIPPSNPVFKNYEMEGRYIRLDWINSPDEDVVKTQLLRRKTNETWETLATFTNYTVETSYVDSSLASLTEYEYDLAVSDAAGNTSTSVVPVKVKSPEQFIVINFPSFTAEVNEDNSRVILKWTADKPSLVSDYIIYREYDGEEYSTWRVVDGEEFTIFDDQLHEGKTHRYTIKAKVKDGYITTGKAAVSITL